MTLKENNVFVFSGVIVLSQFTRQYEDIVMPGKQHVVSINRIDTWISQLPGLLELWNVNYTSRRQLRELDDALLRDIGLDRITAEREAKKPFWRK